MLTETIPQKVLSLDEKRLLVEELHQYHDFNVQSELAEKYTTEFGITERSFREYIQGRRKMSGSQIDYCIVFFEERTTERALRETFLRLFGTQPETYGYFINRLVESSNIDQMTDFEKFKKGIGAVVQQKKQGKTMVKQ